MRLQFTQRLVSTCQKFTSSTLQYNNIRHATTSAVAAATSDNVPSVFDKIVKLTFVDPSGARRIVPGYIGKTIYETCEQHGIDLGPASVGAPVEAIRSSTWTEPLFGEGPTTGFDHILISGKGVESATPMNWVEESALKEYWDEDEIFPESRLATQVILTKEMDGMTVFVPDRICDDIP